MVHYPASIKGQQNVAESAIREQSAPDPKFSGKRYRPARRIASWTNHNYEDSIPTELSESISVVRSSAQQPQEFTEELVNDLLIFEQPSSNLSVTLLVCKAIRILWDSILIAVPMVGTHLINTIAIMLLNWHGSPREQAAAGLAIAYNLWFFEAIVIAMFDKFGIDWSRSFGAKQYHLTKVYFNQAMVVIVCTFAATTLPAYIFSERILVTFGALPELAASVATVLKTLAVADGLESVSKTIKVFCMAQGQEQVFSPTAPVIFLAALASQYWFIVIQKNGAVGWAYCRIVHELANLLVCLLALIEVAHPETWGFTKLEIMRQDLRRYFVDSFKYALGSYTECLGYLISNYFVILTHDENQIAAFTIIESLEAVLYALGEAFATIMRTRMNILIGKKLNRIAKNFAMFFFGFLLVCCVALVTFLYCIRASIVELYTSHSPPLKSVFSTIIVLFSLFGAPIDMIKLSGAVAMKTIGRNDELVSLNTFLYIIAQAGFGFAFHTLGIMNSSVAYSIVTLAGWVVLVVTVYRSYSSDWNQVEHSAEFSAEEPLLGKGKLEMQGVVTGLERG